MPARPSRRVGAALPESLEPRTLLSSAFLNVNAGKLAGSQAEGAITVDRADPTKVFVLTNIDSGDGLMASTSSDGGHTWKERLIADDKDGLPPACCDPSASFDIYGNLFVTYISSNDKDIIVLTSTDAGQSFAMLAKFHGNIDQPTIATGPGSVWLTFQKNNAIVATGAPVTGPGAVGSFIPLQKIHGSANGNFGDISIGPAGQVMVTYQVQESKTLSKIFVNTGPGGVAEPTFGKAILAATTHVPDFDYIPAQPERSVDAEAGLAFDRSGGPYNGRVYLVYTEETPAASANTDILMRYSDNQGATWSQPVSINDDATLNGQFLPRISIDNTTGQVAVGWYDARNDLGNGAAGDTNNLPNDDAEYWTTIVTSQPNGLVVSPNQQVSAGVSNAYDAYDPNSSSISIDYGDYAGLDFNAGTILPLWFDNSNSTGDNPDGTLKMLDAYTATVPASAFAAGTTVSLGGLAAPRGPVAALYYRGLTNPGFVKHGSSYSIAVIYYRNPAAIDPASFGDANLLVTGPNGFSATARLAKIKALKTGAVVVTYVLINPSGAWKIANDGTYAINLQSNQVLDDGGQATPGGVLGHFAVASNKGKGSHAGGTGFRHHHQHHD